MTEEQAQLFLTLKFTTIPEVVAAFTKAINAPKGYTFEISTDTVMKGIGYWVEQGAPETITITKDNVEFFLIIKFGSTEKAYYYWVNNPNHNLSDIELETVMDYIPAPEETRS